MNKIRREKYILQINRVVIDPEQKKEIICLNFINK